MSRFGLVTAAFLLAAGAAAAQTTPVSSLPPLAPVPSPTPSAPLTPAPGENLVAFNDLAVDLLWRDNHWQLTAGPVTLKDFGRRDLEGRLALRLIRELGLTEHGTIGSPEPVMEYWLSHGRAPQGLAPGLRLIPLDRASLRAEPVQGQWCLRDNYRILFNFMDKAEDAKAALAVIQKYRFSQVGVIGQNQPLVQIFLARPDEVDPATDQPGLTPPPKLRNLVFPKSGASNNPAAASPLVGTALPPLHAVPGSGTTRGSTSSSADGAQGTRPSDLLRAPAFDRAAWSDLADRIPVSWHQAQVQHDATGWKLVCGGQTLAQFGTNEREAKLGLAAVRYYRFTEKCQAGPADHPVTYFLVNGQAPRGLMLGAHYQTFQPEALAVKQLASGWAVCEGKQPLLEFGDKEQEARKMLGAIQHNRFDHLCWLGDDHAMTFFVRVR